MADHHVPVSRPPRVRLGAVAAAGDAGLRHRLCLYRHAGVRRPGAGDGARAVRLGNPPGLLVSRDPLSRRRHRDDDPGAVPLRLSAVAGRVPGAVGLRAGSQPHPGPRSVERFLRRGPAVGPPGHRRRRVAGADGDPQRFRHGGFLRRPHIHRRYLRCLAQHEQRLRGGAAGGGHAERGADPDRHGAPGASRPALPPHHDALSRAAELPASRASPGARGPGLRAAGGVRFHAARRRVARLSRCERRRSPGAAVSSTMPSTV